MKLLNKSQESTAVRFYAKHPGLAALLPPAFVSLSPPFGSPEFAQAVADFQGAHGLFVDGKAGRKETIPSLVAAYGIGSPRGDLLIFRGETKAIPGVSVVNPWAPNSFDFARWPGHTHGKFGIPLPRVVLLHDSITRTAKACFDVLLTRKDKRGKNMRLGTGLMLDPDAVLYQCVPDLSVLTWHAGVWNGVAVGFDMIGLLDPAFAPNHALRRPPTVWADRGYIDYTVAQKRVLPRVVEGLCGLLGVPVETPREANGKLAYRGPDQKLDVSPLTYRGVLGHGQVSRARWDGNLALACAFGETP